MFWPLNLPIAITTVLMAAVVGAAIFLSPRFPAWQKRILLLTPLICFIAYVPACMGIMIYVIDPLRFGVFKYKDYGAIHNGLVKRYLPEAAEDITANSQAGGFMARFRASRKDLDEWKAEQWKRDGAESGDPIAPSDESEGESLLKSFGDEPLKPQENIVVFDGPRARNGAGATIYFFEVRGIAYEDAGYW